MILLPHAPSFGDPNLAAAIERLSPDEIDALPYGAIHVDQEGVVQFYSKAERRLSGSGERPRTGLAFFTRIAPCMDNDAFRGRIERAAQAGKLDIAFIHIGDFEDDERELSVRIQSAAGGGFWIFMSREP